MQNTNSAKHVNNISNIVNLEDFRKKATKELQDFMDKHQKQTESAEHFKARLENLKEKLLKEAGVNKMTFYERPRGYREKLATVLAALNNNTELDDNTGCKHIGDWVGADDIADNGLTAAFATFYLYTYKTGLNMMEIFEHIKRAIDYYSNPHDNLRSDMHALFRHFGFLAGRCGASIYDTFEDQAMDEIADVTGSFAILDDDANREDRAFEKHIFTQALRAANEEINND